MTYVSPLNYGTYTSALATLCIISSNDTNFQTILPQAIDYAEQRIWREADLLNSRQTDYGTVTSTSRWLTYPTNVGVYIVVDQINLFVPAGSSAVDGARRPLSIVSREYISTMYPSDTKSVGTPSVMAVKDDNMVLVGPVPDNTYYFEIIGTQRPPILSASNSSTFLTMNYPDVFLNASMVFMTGYMKNWGSQGDDPKMAQSWENQYQISFKSMNMEQFRAKFEAEAWQSQSQAPNVTPPRS